MGSIIKRNDAPPTIAVKFQSASPIEAIIKDIQIQPLDLSVEPDPVDATDIDGMPAIPSEILALEGLREALARTITELQEQTHPSLLVIKTKIEEAEKQANVSGGVSSDTGIPDDLREKLLEAIAENPSNPNYSGLLKMAPDVSHRDVLRFVHQNRSAGKAALILANVRKQYEEVRQQAITDITAQREQNEIDLLQGQKEDLQMMLEAFFDQTATDGEFPIGPWLDFELMLEQRRYPWDGREIFELAESAFVDWQAAHGGPPTPTTTTATATAADVEEESEVNADANTSDSQEPQADQIEETPIPTKNKGKVIEYAKLTAQTLEGHESTVCGIDITYNGKYAISASSDQKIGLWDLAAGKLLRMLEGHTDKVYSAALTPDGKHAVSASADSTLRLWDLKSGKTIRVLEGHEAGALAVEVTPDGNHAVSASSDNRLIVWDLSTGDVIHTLKGHKGKVWDLALTPDGEHVISASSDQRLRVWDLATGELVKPLEGHTAKVYAVEVTPSGKHAVSSGADKTLMIWDLETGKCIDTREDYTSDHWPLPLAIMPNGRQAISATADQILSVWNLSDGKIVIDLEGHENGVKSVCPSPDGKYAVSGSEDNTIRIWDLAQEQ